MLFLSTKVNSAIYNCYYKKICHILNFLSSSKRNQELETSLNQQPPKKWGWKKKDPIKDSELTNDTDWQTVASTPKTITKRRHTIQELDAVNEVLNEGVDMIQEPATAATAKLIPINELLELSDNNDLLEGNHTLHKAIWILFLTSFMI